MIVHKTINPKVQCTEVSEKIALLHQQYFDLKTDEIIKNIKKRDYIDMYYNNHGDLIGTVGIQWYHFGNNVILYLGNAVIMDNYQQYGLLTKSIYRAILKTIIKYPFKKKL